MTTTILTVCRGNLPPKCRDAAVPALATAFKGWTRTTGEGAWCAPDGTLVLEPIDIWEVATAEVEAFAGMILALGEAAGEHSVYVVTGTTARILETANARGPTDGIRD